jgi:hypothetical protein
MEFKILGTDAPACEALRREAAKALRDLHQSQPIQVVEDLAEIARHHVLRLPALLIDGTVVSAGFIPSAAEIEAMVLARRDGLRL